MSLRGGRPHTTIIKEYKQLKILSTTANFNVEKHQQRFCFGGG